MRKASSNWTDVVIETTWKPMKKLRVGIIDILGKSESQSAYGSFIQATYASIMPQVIGVWCEEMGHDVSIAYLAGPRVLAGELRDDLDIAFVSSYTFTAQVAYAVSAYLRSKGTVTVIGGPHPRSYPEDCVKYFDYAVGNCDKSVVRDILADCTQRSQEGTFVTAPVHPEHLCSIEERWKFLQPILDMAKIIKAVPVVGSLGCPYTCSFCRDALVPYQTLNFEALQADLRFIRQKKVPRSILSWHDPNFGIRFNDYMDAMEEAVPPGSLRSGAGMSFALLGEHNCKRLRHNGFKVVLPGIESWFDMGNKSKLRSTKGREKVERIAEQANMVLRYIPYVQGCLIFGLDADEGPEPFELTKQFAELAPGLFPNLSLLTCYGGNAPDNLAYQRDGRVLRVPFHFQNQLHSMNVGPKNYTWTEFYDHTIDLVEYLFSNRMLWRRFRAVHSMGTRIEQLSRGVSTGKKRLLRNLVDQRSWFKDPSTAKYLKGRTDEVPEVFSRRIESSLGWLWKWLPEGAINHDPNAALKSLGSEADLQIELKAGKTGL